MAPKDYIDPEGYWIDPDRGIHRMSIPDPDGEQSIIAKVAPEASEAEWNMIRDSLMMYCVMRSIPFGDWSNRRSIH